MNKIISPSLLSADFLNLVRQLNTLAGQKNIWLHLDIMDGHFVPNLTFANPLIEQIAKATKIPLDAHLMVSNPDQIIDSLSNINIHNLTFHWEAVVHHDRLIHKAKKIFPSIGIALNPSTNVDLIPDYLLEEINLVLLMSVNPGFGGQSFIPSTLDKIQSLSKKRAKLKTSFQIQVDGGVSDKNAMQLFKSGADNLVAGNYLFGGKNPDLISQISNLRMGNK